MIIKYIFIVTALLQLILVIPINTPNSHRLDKNSRLDSSLIRSKSPYLPLFLPLEVKLQQYVQNSRQQLELDNRYMILNIPIIPSISSVRTLTTSLNIWLEKLSEIRQNTLDIVKNLLERNLPQEQARLYYSIILGQSVSWSEEFANFQELIGTQHIFAASGYNLSVVLMMATFFIPRSFPFNLRPMLLFGFCLAYTWLVGWQASLIRALAMVGYMLVATYIIRRIYKPIYSIGVVFFY